MNSKVNFTQKLHQKAKKNPFLSELSIVRNQAKIRNHKHHRHLISFESHTSDMTDCLFGNFVI